MVSQTVVYDPRSPRRSGPGRTADHWSRNCSTSSRLSTLPDGPSGNESTNSIRRGYLYFARCSLAYPRDLDPQFGIRDARRRCVLHDHRADLLAVPRVGDPDDGHLVHQRVMGEDLLDFTRVDVEPAPQNHVLLPVDDRDEPLLVLDGQVTGSEPVVDDRGLGRLGAVPVALHHVVAADHYLADLARREQLDAVLELGVRDLDLDPPNRVADGAGLAPEDLLVERRHRRGLRQAVALGDVGAENLLEPLEDRHGQRRPPPPETANWSWGRRSSVRAAS